MHLTVIFHSPVAQKCALFSNLTDLPIYPNSHTQLLRYVTAVYIAGDMSLWLGPGLKFLQRIWATPTSSLDEQSPFAQTQLSFTLKLHLCLADAGWGGWKLVAMPVLLKSLTKPEFGLMTHNQKHFIAFLAGLQKGSSLGSANDVDIVWRTKIETVVSAQLANDSWKVASTNLVNLCS